MIVNDQNNKWEITKDNYKLDSVSYTSLHKVWKPILKPFIKPNQNILIINDADQLVRNSIISSNSITICDPKVFDFIDPEYQSVLNTVPYLNVVDSLNYVNKVTLLDMTFLEAVKDECFKEQFDIIIVANNTSNPEITEKEFIEYCYFYLKDHGMLFYQSTKDDLTKNLNFKNCIEYYFTELNRKLKNIPFLNTYFVFSTYRKFSSLI